MEAAHQALISVCVQTALTSTNAQETWEPTCVSPLCLFSRFLLHTCSPRLGAGHEPDRGGGHSSPLVSNGRHDQANRVITYEQESLAGRGARTPPGRPPHTHRWNHQHAWGVLCPASSLLRETRRGGTLRLCSDLPVSGRGKLRCACREDDTQRTGLPPPHPPLSPSMQKMRPSSLEISNPAHPQSMHGDSGNKL